MYIVETPYGYVLQTPNSTQGLQRGGGGGGGGKESSSVQHALPSCGHKTITYTAKGDGCLTLLWLYISVYVASERHHITTFNVN